MTGALLCPGYDQFLIIPQGKSVDLALLGREQREHEKEPDYVPSKEEPHIVEATAARIFFPYAGTTLQLFAHIQTGLRTLEGVRKVAMRYLDEFDNESCYLVVDTDPGMKQELLVGFVERRGNLIGANNN